MSLFDLPAPGPELVSEPQPAGRCRRCKRKITDPVSLEFGIGEDCRDRLGIPPPKQPPRIVIHWTGPVEGQQDLTDPEEINDEEADR